MTSSQTSRGSAGKKLQHLPAHPTSYAARGATPPLLFFFFGGGGCLCTPPPTTNNQAPSKFFKHHTAVSCFLDSILARYIL